jgi:hypothetical protein
MQDAFDERVRLLMLKVMLCGIEILFRRDVRCVCVWGVWD